MMMMMMKKMNRKGGVEKNVGQWKGSDGQKKKGSRAAGGGGGDFNSRRPNHFNISASGIHSGDSGIFVTCDKGQERRCLAEMSDLLSQYIDERIGEEEHESSTADRKDGDASFADEHDIEADIAAELESMKSLNNKNNKENSNENITRISLVSLDIPCVSFIKLPSSVEPVSLVHQICSDAFSHPDQKRSRFIKRMTPVTMMRKTLGAGLEQLCESVLPPHFGDLSLSSSSSSASPAHPGAVVEGSEEERKKKTPTFAIRPSIRNNNQLDRDLVIKTVAKAVGERGKVDLKNYDLLILVEVYRNVVGMSVVGSDFETLKKFNLAEIYQPTPQPPMKTEDKREEEDKTAVEQED